MELVYLLAGAVVGAIAGFFVSKKLSASEQDYQRLEKEVSESKTSLEQYQQEVALHLDNSAQLLEQMNETCKVAMQQMEKSTKLLNTATAKPNAMPFFSADTEANLRANTKKVKPSRKRNEGLATEPPLDYSSDPSGLFNDTKQVVTNSPS